MTLSCRAAWFLVAFAAWNAFVWVTFVRNVFPDHHWDGFFLVHLCIGAVTTAGGLLVGWFGVRALLEARRRAGKSGASASASAVAAPDGAPAGASTRNRAEPTGLS